MNLYKGYIINPESFWQPAYRISPFNTSFISKNYNIIDAGISDNDLLKSFFGEQYIFCENGKHAIRLALEQIGLERNDEVWVITTSGNKYISSCVTNEIEKFCRWSRKKSSLTKLIFVNHEFGFCYNNLEELKFHGLPIIEDRALSFLSIDEKNQTGKIGDFVVYSLPKFFPINVGGVLQYNNPLFYNKVKNTGDEIQHYLSALLSHYLNEVDLIKDKRRNNYKYISELFNTLGFASRFVLSENEVPGVYMFTTTGIDLNKLKIFMQSNGIESSVFYGEEAFFIPVHQELNKEDLDFFFHLISYSLNYGNQ